MLSALALAVLSTAGAHGAAEMGTIFVASCAASVVQKLALFPLDTLKTRAQHDRRTRARDPPGAPPSLAPRAPAASSRAARLRDLYRGLAPSLLGVIPVSLVYMPVYELACAVVAARVGAAYQPLGRALAGSLAGLACSIVHVPTSVLKNRLQVMQFADVRTAAAAVARAEGLAGFYRGWTSAAVLDVLSATVQFVALDRLRTAARALGAPGAPIPPLRTSLIGCAAGAITALCTEPLDVVKTRLTTQPLAAADRARDGGKAAARRGVGGTLREIARTEGGLALWRGLAPRVAYNGLKGAVWYSAYEWSRAALLRRR